MLITTITIKADLSEKIARTNYVITFVLTNGGIMKTTTHTNEFIGKVLPDSLGQPLNRENEYKKINNSSARWWFECLLLSDEYKSR